MGTTDSKLAFRKGVFRLFEERNIPHNMDEYWTLFWTLPETIDDVYTLISISDIRRTRDTAMENLETLIDRLMDQMDSLLNSSNIQNIHLLNCCRVLTRVMPFIFESSEHSDWEDRFFWTPRLIEKESTDNQKPQYNTLPPRGETLILLTLKSLFLAGFTLPSTVGNTESRVSFVIWETGVGCSTPIGSSRDNDMNRTEVLRLLTVLLSKSMYTAPSQIVSKEDRWLNYMTTKIEKKVVLAFLCSMINVSCKYNPMGWTVVPYNHIMFTDPRESLVAHCLRILLVVLDYCSPAAKQFTSNVAVEEIQESNNEDEPVRITERPAESTDNIFQYYLSKLHRGQDFQFLIDGIYRILNSPMQPLNNYIPGSLKRVRYHVEMLMLCWKLLEINTRFSNYLMETERGLDLMVVLIFYANENKLDPWTLSTLYPALVVTITNISSYLKHLSPIASSKLLSLFSSMSAPGFLLADEANHKLIEYLLEAFNNIIRFQFSDNPHFIYALLRHSQKFKRLADFNLNSALNERPAKDGSREEEGISEKAKGKLPENSASLSSSSSPSPSSQENLTHFSGGKNGFVPSNEWVNSWHSHLPLDTVATLITYLKPRLEKSGLTSEKAIEYIKNVSFSDILLPSPAHPVHVRKFQWVEPLLIWFQSMLWGHTYISSVSNYGPWNNTQIKLFHIKHQPPASEPVPTFTSAPTSSAAHSPRPSLAT
ncbi:hypothetical protein G6F46_007818 [Rhizopus delemar]|nr:hypothetical protein G6F55_006787 [Rhizopus delemar]KAG1541200.1 hypothetical protein G6F51_008043 [Rhizopus arrhizus]KAG1495246.1 hypothetical protein G6F54_007309 [Rhizopus delemar]KAG1509222.1 hypothetical protein G6F53_007614 [Rhizopus delemar]KAG1524869.1 hypothetical protein G6F52_003829 [Rhizopus delemar]